MHARCGGWRSLVERTRIKGRQEPKALGMLLHKLQVLLADVCVRTI